MTGVIFALASMWASCASENLTLGPEHYANFLGCMEGPGDPAMRPAYPCSSCECPGGECWMLCWPFWDCDGDKDIDLADFGAFQRAERGEP